MIFKNEMTEMKTTFATARFLLQNSFFLHEGSHIVEYIENSPDGNEDRVRHSFTYRGTKPQE